MNWLRYGPDAVLFRLTEDAGSDVRARMRAVSRDLAMDPPESMREFTPAFQQVLIEFKPDAPVEAIAVELERRFRSLAPLPPEETPEHVIPVVYDGIDLGELAERNGLTPEDVVAVHRGRIYEVAMLGFSPGFPYLAGLDPRLHAPRRASPRPVVPAGSVAIGGVHTGIYSIDSPGGWNLIGRTRLPMFERAEDGGLQFRLAVFDRVRFVPIANEENVE
jgi:inhibitor of KinA